MLLARGSSDNVAVYGRYLIEMASRRPAGLAAPSVHTRYQADVDYTGYLVVALSQSGATPEVVETAASMRRAGAVVIGIANEPGSPLTQVCDLALLTEAGPELAVPATKTVTAQMLAVAAIAAAYDSELVAAADLAALPDAVASLLADAGPSWRATVPARPRRRHAGRTRGGWSSPGAGSHTRPRSRPRSRSRRPRRCTPRGCPRPTCCTARSPRSTPGSRCWSSPAASGSRPTRRR